MAPFLNRFSRGLGLALALGFSAESAAEAKETAIVYLESEFEVAGAEDDRRWAFCDQVEEAVGTRIQTYYDVEAVRSRDAVDKVVGGRLDSTLALDVGAEWFFYGNLRKVGVRTLTLEYVVYPVGSSGLSQAGKLFRFEGLPRDESLMAKVDSVSREIVRVTCGVAEFHPNARAKEIVIECFEHLNPPDDMPDAGKRVAAALAAKLKVPGFEVIETAVCDGVEAHVQPRRVLYELHGTMGRDLENQLTIRVEVTVRDELAADRENPKAVVEDFLVLLEEGDWVRPGFISRLQDRLADHIRDGCVRLFGAGG